MSAAYTAPRGIQLSAAYRVMSGVPGQRTYLFRSLPQSSTLTIPLDAFGSESGAVRPNLDIKVGKRVSFGGRRLEGSIDILNALNNNAAWTTNYASGPTYNYTTSISQPRTARVTVTFAF
jgi:hypothetical protein